MGFAVFGGVATGVATARSRTFDVGVAFAVSSAGAASFGRSVTAIAGAVETALGADGSGLAATMVVTSAADDDADDAGGLLPLDTRATTPTATATTTPPTPSEIGLGRGKRAARDLSA